MASKVKLNSPSDFTAAVTATTAVQLLPPSSFETVHNDSVAEFSQTISSIVNVLDEYSHLKEVAGSHRMPDGQHLRSHVADSAAAGDNSEMCLQRLVADLQLLQSKLHQFSAHSSAVDQDLRPPSMRRDNTRSIPLSDNADAKIAQLQQHYDAEVRRLGADKDAMQAAHSKTVAELESKLLEQEMKYKSAIAECESELSRTQQAADARLTNLQKLASDEKETLLSKISEYQHQLDQQSSELSRLRTYLAESETLSQSTNTLQKEIVNLKGQMESVQRDRDHLSTENSSLVTRLNALTDVLTTQEHYLSQCSGDTNAAKRCLLTRWREKVFELLVQLKSTSISASHESARYMTKLSESEKRVEEVDNKCEVLCHTLRDKQAVCDMQQSRIDNLTVELQKLQCCYDDEQQLHKQTASSLHRLSELVERMLEGYKVSVEAHLKQGCSKLQAFNKRISFASSRMELLQAQLLRQKAMMTACEEMERPSADVTTDSEMEALSLELSRVVAERDSLAAQIKADAVTMSDRIHQATKQASDEAVDLRRRLADVHSSLDSRSAQYTELVRRLELMQAELSDAHIEIESLKTELAKAHLYTKAATDELRSSMEEEHRRQMTELEHDLADAKRQLTKTVVSLRQLERQLDRDKEKSDTELTAARAVHQDEVDKLTKQLQTLQSDNNLLMTTLKQQGLLGRHQSRLTAAVPSSDKSSSQTTSQQQSAAMNDVMQDLKQLAAQLLSADSDSGDDDDVTA